MKNENKVRILAFAGVLIAMNIVLARLVAINIGPTLRITVSQTPIFLAGFWFGPVVGGHLRVPGRFDRKSSAGLCAESVYFCICHSRRCTAGAFKACTSEKSRSVAVPCDHRSAWSDRFFRLYLPGTAHLLWNTLECSVCQPAGSDPSVSGGKFHSGLYPIQKPADSLC